MSIDPNLFITILTSSGAALAPVIVYLVKLGKDVAIVKNDIKWLKLKSFQRRNEIFQEHEIEET